MTTATTEHKVHYTESNPTFLEYDCTASCSCGWSAKCYGGWPTDARRVALSAGLKHSSDEYFKHRSNS